MTITAEQRRALWEKQQRRREFEEMAKTHVCAECGQPLVTPVDPATGDIILVCGTDRSHQGYRTRGKTRHVGFGAMAYVGPDFAAPPISALRYVDALYDRQLRRIREAGLTPQQQFLLEWELQSVASAWQASHRRREWPPPARTPREWRAIFLETGQQQVWECMVRHQAEKGVGTLDSKALAVMPMEQMLERMKGVKFPQEMTPPQRVMLAEAAIQYELDPVMGELMLYQGHLYVSIDGRYRKAQETGNLAGVETRPATQQERDDWQIPDDDYFFRSEVYVKGIDRPFVGWGRVRQIETKPPSDPRRRGFRPLETNPQRMAEKRAEAQALRKAFHIPLPSAEMIGEEGAYPDAIDTEARELAEEEPEPQVDEETGEVRPRSQPTDVTQTEEPGQDDAPKRPPADLPMKTLGDLFNACHEYFGKKKTEVYRILNVSDATEIADVGDAWATVCAHLLEPEDTE